MSLGLKNARATYQRLVDTAFQSQIRRNLEAYVDDMVVKSKTEKEMIADIAETIDNLRQINVKLNLKNAHLGWGKENSYDTWSPLNRFLSHSAEKSLPFFETLKNITKENKDDYRWTDDAEIAFQELKKIVLNLASLITPMPKETLYVHLDASQEVVSVVLLVERKGNQCPVHYERDKYDGRRGGGQLDDPYHQVPRGRKVAKDPNEARTLQMKINQYVIEEGVLFKRSYLMPMLRCVGPLQANYVIWEMHMGACIMHLKASRCAPQANGLVEKANRYLMEGIKTRLGRERKGWVDELPNVVWAHRTSLKTSNGETSCSLTFGSEAVIPGEIGMSTHRTMMIKEGKGNEEKMRLNLDLLQERREATTIREARNKMKMKNYYNKRARLMSFKVGDYVYRRNETSHVENLGKLGPKWEGPYVVTEAYHNGSYKLQTMDDIEVSRTWHAINLRRCYL
ncbi:reverse transcriptase domain-containing protein [Tanacetum coccineum]